MKSIKTLVLTALLVASYSSVSAQLEWVQFEGELPANTVVGGVETHRELPICRCKYKGARHPGKVVEKACNFGYGGLEKAITKFEVLVNKGIVELNWLKVDQELPENAVRAGKENGETLYVGRAFHEGGTHPGKIFKVGDKYICNIGYAGKEITYTVFEVLVQHRPGKNHKKLRRDSSLCLDKSFTPIVVSNLGSISKGQQIDEGFSLVSNNLRYQTRVTDDGRLVVEKILEHGLCDEGKIVIAKTKEIWSNTTTKGDPAKDYFLKFQEDGNLCIYSKQDGFVWCSMSNEKEGHHFEITNVGHIEVVNNFGAEIWPD